MTEKRFTTNGYYIYDHFKEDKWLVNEVEAEEIVTVMNNLDTKARERSKALSKLQKENEQLKHFKEISDNIAKEVEDFFEKHEFDTVNFDIFDEVFDDVDYYYEKCIRLKKENKQLKHRLAISEKANFITALEKENGKFKKALQVAYSTNLTEPTKNTIEQIAKHCGVDLE